MTRLRNVAAAAGLVVILLAGATALPGLLARDGVDYSHVASIETAPEYQDPALLAEAWALPVATTYRAGFDFQHNQSFCGPTSVVDVARSLGIPSYQATVLDGTGIFTMFGMLPGGIAIDRLADVARMRTGRRVTVLRDLDPMAFREHMRKANDPSRRYVVNFTRGPLFGGPGGHHSPVGGYLADRDLVFVLDVNRAYGPWLVGTDRLFEAVNTVDPSTHLRRGLLLIE